MPKLIAFDVETFLFSVGNKAPKIVVGTFASADSDGLIFKRDELEDVLEALLDEMDVVIGGQNIAYDMACSITTFPRLIRKIFDAYKCAYEGPYARIVDSKLAEMLLDIARTGYTIGRQYDLATLARSYLGEQLDKDTWRMRYHELDDVPLEQWPEGAVQYAIGDAVSTYRILTCQLADADLLEDLGRQAAAAFALYLNTCWGIHTDAVMVERLAAITRQDIDESRDLLLQHGMLTPLMTGRGKNKVPTGEYKRNTKEAKARLLEVCKEQEIEPDKTDSGDISLSEAALSKVHDDVLAAYALYSKASSIETEVEKLRLGVEMPIHPNYNTLLETGRTSSGGGEAKINIQNRRRKFGFREVFVPREGRVFASLDYPQIELRTLAQTCIDLLGYSKLGEAINSGKDPHLVTAASFLDISYDDAKKRKGEKLIKDMRNLAKAFNFGLPGGLGEVTFVGFAKASYGQTIERSVWSLEPREGFVEVEPRYLPKSLDLRRILGWDFLPLERLKIFGDEEKPKVATYSILKAGFTIYVKQNTFGHLLARWFAAYPEILEYFEYVRNDMPKDEHGERIVQMVRSKRYRAGCTYCQACNTGFQAPAADGAKRALFYLSYEMYAVPESPLYGARIVAFVHDEVIIEIDWDKRTKGLERAAEIMAEAMNHTIPDVPCTVEPAVMLRWTKSAETVYRDGELWPWELHRIEELPALVQQESDLKKRKVLIDEYEELFEYLERKKYVQAADYLELGRIAA